MQERIININFETQPEHLADIFLANEDTIHIILQDVYTTNILPIVKSEINYGDGDTEQSNFTFVFKSIQDNYVSTNDIFGSQKTEFSHQYTNTGQYLKQCICTLKTLTSDFTEKTFIMNVYVLPISSQFELNNFKIINNCITENEKLDTFLNIQLENNKIIPLKITPS